MKAIPAVAAVFIATGLVGCTTLVERDGMRFRCDHERVNVTAVRGHLQVNKETVEVCRGYSVTLRLTNLAANQAHSRAKANGPSWLDRDNTNPREIVFEVPEREAPGEYEYILKVDDVGLLDPRIVVQ